MEYQKIINLLENTPNQLRKFRTKYLVKFKTSMLRSSLCNYNNAYILLSAIITVAATAGNNRKIIKNFAPFTNCISEVNNTQIDNAKDFGIAMTMYNLIEYSDDYVSYFWRILEMLLINCEINLTLTWSNRCFIIINNLIPGHEPKFTMVDTKRYVSVVSLSTQDNARLLEQLKSGFKRTINWNKYD